MVKKRRSSKRFKAPQPHSTGDGSPAVEDRVGHDAAAARAGSERPPGNAPQMLSFAIVLHFAAIILSLTSNYAPSYLQGSLLDYLSPYLVTTHQVYGARPLELTHGDSIDFPLVVEVQRSGTQGWKQLQLWNSERQAKNSRWHNLGRIISIVAQDQPDSELLSEIAFQIVQYAESRTTRRLNAITAVRFVQPHVMSFDEDSLVARGQTIFLEEELTADVIFTADVVRSGDRLIGMLPVQDASRNSQAIRSPEASE